jgi:hypothetical protein
MYMGKTPQQKMGCFIERHPHADSEKRQDVTHENIQKMTRGPKMGR